MKKILVENEFGHGAIQKNVVSRLVNRHLIREQRGGSFAPFDWDTGFDVESKVGSIAIKNQGASFSCGGQALSYFLEVQGRLRGGNEVISAKSMYAPIAFTGGGTTVTAMETQLGAHGGNLEADIPSLQGSNPPSEPFMSDKSWETPERVADAVKRAGYTPISVPKDIESIACAIRDYGGVLWEIRGSQNFTWRNVYPRPPQKGDKFPTWCHFMCGKGARKVNGVKQVDFLQSWGLDVGWKGIQSFTEDYINSPHILDIFTFVKDTEVQLIPDNNSIWYAVWQWFVSTLKTA